MPVHKTEQKITDTKYSEFEYKEKLDLVYRAINSTQEIIRFSDTKAGTVIVLITALIAATISFMDKYTRITQSLTSYPIARTILLGGACIFLLCIISALFMALKSINPSRDTTSHVDLSDVKNVPAGLYYITGLTREMKLGDYIREIPDLKLSVTMKQYYDKISATDLDGLMKTLIADLLRISYIKEKKMKRTEAALRCIVYGIWTLGGTVILSLLTIQIYQWVR